MSENNEVIRSGYEAFARQDIPGVLERFAEDIEWDVPESLPNGGVHRGHDGVSAFFASIADAYGELRVEPDEYIDAEGDRVVVRGHHRGRGHNGAEFEADFVHIWTVRDGKAATFFEVADSAAIAPAIG
jgi:ketosteroid isomerase-like protein